jgi:hypothetical protein
MGIISREWQDAAYTFFKIVNPDRMERENLILDVGNDYKHMLFNCRQISDANFDKFVAEMVSKSETYSLPSLKFALTKLIYFRENGIQSINVGGPMGSGKSKFAEPLAASLNYEFMDSDYFHSEENINKMARGIPLSDLDRYPFLEGIRVWLNSGKRITTCSALTVHHRSVISGQNLKNPNYGMLHCTIIKSYETALKELDSNIKCGNLRFFNGTPHFIQVTAESEQKSIESGKPPLLRNQYDLFEMNLPLPWESLLIDSNEMFFDGKYNPAAKLTELLKLPFVQ